jgi:hypothetical protein
LLHEEKTCWKFLGRSIVDCVAPHVCVPFRTLLVLEIFLV